MLNCFLTAAPTPSSQHKSFWEWMTLGRGLQSHCPVSLSIQWLSSVILTLPLMGSRKYSLSMPDVHSQVGRLLRNPPSRSLSIFITPDSRTVCVRGTESSILGPYLSCLLLPPWGDLLLCMGGLYISTWVLYSGPYTQSIVFLSSHYVCPKGCKGRKIHPTTPWETAAFWGAVLIRVLMLCP